MPTITPEDEKRLNELVQILYDSPSLYFLQGDAGQAQDFADICHEFAELLYRIHDLTPRPTACSDFAFDFVVPRGGRKRRVNKGLRDDKCVSCGALRYQHSGKR